MGTRAILTFKDNDGGTFHVYKHYDGYPTGIADEFTKLGNSGKVWSLPRYEANEFAAGFVAVAKEGQGNVRLAMSRRAACDVQYGYTVYMKKGCSLPRLTVAAVDGWDTWKETRLWDGPLTAFTREVAEGIEAQ